MRDYLTTAGLNLRLVPLPAYSPDFNPDEAIWDWIREEETANTCFGTAAKVREHLDRFFAGLASRTAEVKQRCRSALQALADALATPPTNHVDPAPDSVQTGPDRCAIARERHRWAEQCGKGVRL